MRCWEYPSISKQVLASFVRFWLPAEETKTLFSIDLAVFRFWEEIPIAVWTISKGFGLKGRRLDCIKEDWHESRYRVALQAKWMTTWGAFVGEGEEGDCALALGESVRKRIRTRRQEERKEAVMTTMHLSFKHRNVYGILWDFSGDDSFVYVWVLNFV